VSYLSDILARSPLALYRLGEASGTTAADSSGNARDATYGDTGNLVYSRPSLIPADTSDTAVAFGGTNQARAVAASAAWMQPTVITVLCSINPDTVSGNGEIIGRASSTLSASSAFSWRIVRLTNTLFFRVYVNNSSTTTAVTSSAALSAGVTARCAFVFDNATIKIYVDGVEVGSAARTGTLNPGTYPLVIGTSCTTNTSTFGGSQFDGDIDEVAILGTALSAADVLDDYESTQLQGLELDGVTPPVQGSFSLDAVLDVTLDGVTPPVQGAFTVDTAALGLTLDGQTPPVLGSFALDAVVDVTLDGVTPPVVGAFTVDNAVAPVEVTLDGVTPPVKASFTLVNPMGTNQGDGNGDDGGAYAVFDWDPPVVEPPVPFVFRDEIAAHAYTAVDTTGRPGFVGHITKTRTRRWTRILVAGRDVTFLNGIATPQPTYSLISPLLYGSGSISFPQYPAFLYGSAAIPAWIKPGASVVVQRINEDLEVTGISYRGFLLDVNVSGRDLTFGLSGEASGRAALVDQPPRVFRKRNSLEFWWDGLIRDLHLPLGNSAATGIVMQNRGGMDMLTYANELSANGAKRGGAIYTNMPNMDGEYRVVQKDLTTIDATVYFDDAHTKPDLRRDPAEEPNVMYATAVSPTGRRIRFTSGGVLADQKVLPYPMNDGSAFGVGTTDADTDTGGGVTAMIARLVWTKYLSHDDRPGGFDSDVADAIEDLQDDAGIAQTGNMNENTWAALFDEAITGYSITGTQIRPAIQRAKVRRYDRTASGAVLGPNPDYDPTVLPIHATRDYGTGHTENQVKNFARADLNEAEASNWVGQIVFNTGGLILGEHIPGTAIGTVMDARQLKPGMNIWAPLFDGGTLFHVSGCEVGQTSDGRPLVTAQVDTRFRDTMAVNEIIDRNRESRIKPARNWARDYRSSGKVNDVVSEWDNNGGVLPDDVDLQGGTWTVIGLPAGQEGIVQRIRLLFNNPCEYGFALFGSKIEAEKLNRRLGNPLSPSDKANWEDPDILEDLDENHYLLGKWGDDETPCGYWPVGKNEDGGLDSRGKFQDDAGIAYFCFDDASLWLAIYPAQDTTLLAGRILKNQLESGS
jgi:hypothetical protein